MTDLEQRAKDFATAAHERVGQKRKYTGEPYISHPAAVVELVRSVPHDEAMLAAAWLHDTVEDCGITVYELGEKFGADVAMLVDALTDPPAPTGSLQFGSPDMTREQRKAAARHRLARSSGRAKTIKLADLIDNAGSILERDMDFARVYINEKRQLLKVLKDGDPTLWARADAIVRLARNTLSIDFRLALDKLVEAVAAVDAAWPKRGEAINEIGYPRIDGQDMPRPRDMLGPIRSWRDAVAKSTALPPPRTPRARLDADRTAKPKTQLRSHVEVDATRGTHTIVAPPADTHVDLESGERTPLAEPQPGDDARAALEAMWPERRACPCFHTTPCQPGCTCVVPVSSAGCLRCCSYGSPEQQKAMAVRLASRDSLTERVEWADRDDEWTERIKAAFPTRSGSHEEYGIAMRMVGNRHGKFALLALVNWLLLERARPAMVPLGARELTPEAQTAWDQGMRERAARAGQPSRWGIWCEWLAGTQPPGWLRYGDRDGTPAPGAPITFDTEEQAADRAALKRYRTSGIRFEARPYVEVEGG